MATQSKAKKLQDKLSPDQVEFDELQPGANVAPRTPGQTDVQFPTDKLSAKSPKDELMDMKLKLQDQPGVTPFGQLRAKDEDFKWLAKKQETVEKANFQHWFAEYFDKMSPAEKKVARELYPNFYKQRQALLKKQSKNLYKLASLKLNGIQNQEDLQTQYMAETGRLDVGPLENLLNPQKNAGSSMQAFERGLLNPFRVYGNQPVSRLGRQANASAYYPGASAPAAPSFGPAYNAGGARGFESFVLGN